MSSMSRSAGPGRVHRSTAVPAHVRSDSQKSYSQGNQVGQRAKRLGSNAKFGPGCENSDEAQREGRRRRFKLQDRARRLLRGNTRKDRKGNDAPYRIENCLLAPGWQASGATVARLLVPGIDAPAAVATYRSLQVCASVWHCPVCAARIANERRGELVQAVTRAESADYKTVLVTLTARHDRHTDLESQLAAMTEAHRRLWRGGAADRLRARYGVLGMVRSLEATHSKLNGWHPHIHIIIFIRASVDVAAFGAELRALWERAAAKCGLTMNEHGFDIMDSTARIAEYIAKWGREPRWREADELARWHTKKGRPVRTFKGHYSPWQLLDFADAGDRNAGDLWTEYALVFHGRKQLHWSAGLRKALGMDEEITDEEAAEKEMEGNALDYEISLDDDQWDWIKGNDMRVELLELVEQSPAGDIIARCRELFDFEPILHIPRLDEGTEPELEEDVQRMMRVLAQLQHEPEQLVVTPSGPGRTLSIVRCNLLRRWRVSVLLDQADRENASTWRAFDLSEIELR